MTSAVPAMDTFGVFGTNAVLLVTEPAALPSARLLADAELAAVDLACSRFRPDSELSMLNRSNGQLTLVSELFTDLIAAALRAAELTEGTVDPTCGQALTAAGYDRDFSEIRSGAGDRSGPAAPNDLPGPGGLTDQPGPGVLTDQPGPGGLTDQPGPGGLTGQATPARPAGQATPARSAGQARRIPGWCSVWLDRDRRQVRLDHGAQLDLGATAKAWAADHCAARIASGLGCGVLVSLGGDIAVAGPPPPGGWQIRVTDDHAAPADAPGQTVTIRSGGLATSSTTVRSWTAGGQTMHHIIDPATGEPARSCWRTVSVAAGTCVDANIASTAAIIRGDAASAWLRDAGLPARLVRHDGSVLTTPGWPADGPPG